MKKIFFALAFVFVTTAAMAQNQIYISASAGVSMPAFQEQPITSSIASFGIGWFVSEAVSLEANVSYVDRFTTDREMMRPTGDNNILPATFIALKGRYHFLTDRVVSPYVGAAVNWGFTRANGYNENYQNWNDDSYGYSRSNMAAFSALVGADVRLSQSWSVFAEVEVMHSMASDAFERGSTMRVQLGVKLTF